MQRYMKQLGVILIATYGLPAYSAQKDSLCKNAKTYECASKLNRTDATGEFCLAKLTACGEYDDIIGSLYVESFDLVPFQKYFLGSALYYKFVATRSNSDRCEYLRSAKDVYTSFLKQQQERFWQDGNYGSLSLDYIRSASNTLNRLNAVKGCLESSPSEADFIEEATVSGRERVIDLFLNPEKSATLKPKMDNLFENVLQGFVSKASDLTTGIELRKVEVKANQTKMDNIKAMYDDTFGGVSTSNDGNVSVGLPTKLDGYNTFETEATAIYGAFKTAVANNVDKYEQLKLDVEKIANAVSQNAIRHYNTQFKIFPQALPEGHPVESLKKELDTALKESQVEKDFNMIKTKMKSKYGKPFCPKINWYCK